ncbi:ATP-binding protein [Actinoplanes sp. NPDC049596]|uniref:ATP-binding protein n=1 Tax=unclassified Actinoplanes TaxID=2626549 RepID=UPI003436ACDA
MRRESSVGRLLTRAFAGLVVLVAGCGAVELGAVLVEHHAERELATEVQPLQRANADLRVVLTDAQAGLRGYTLTGDERMLDTYDVARSEYGLVGDELIRLGAGRATAAAAGQIDRADSWWVIADQQRRAAPGSDEAIAYAAQSEPLFHAFVAANDELRNAADEQAGELLDRADALRWVTIGLVAALSLGAAAVAIITAVRTRRRIVGPLTAIVAEAERKAAAERGSGTDAGPDATTAGGFGSWSGTGRGAGAEPEEGTRQGPTEGGTAGPGPAESGTAGQSLAKGGTAGQGLAKGGTAGQGPAESETAGQGLAKGGTASQGSAESEAARQGPAEIRAIAEALDAAAERTAEVRRHEELVSARLHEIDTVKTDFMSTVSHELRTPLTSISGYVELMRDAEPGQLTAAQERMLDVIARNARRLRDLIEDILTLSQIESGDFRTMRGPLDLAEVVLRGVAAVEPAAAKALVGLHVDVRGPVTVRGDSGQLDRVLDNLLSNAVKFTPAEGSVTVSAGQRGDQAVLVIADTGMGIPEPEQETLFGRFFRASNAIRQAVPGTGLGLAIVHTILANHDGSIEVRSTENIGTTVTVTLPMADLVPTSSGPGGTARPANADATGARAVGSSGRGRRWAGRGTTRDGG